MTGNNRIKWFDGLKGISCLLIFLHHFLLVFYPAVHYGEKAPSWFYNIDTALSQSPLSVLVNGNFMVALFCMISSVIISLQVMNMREREKLADVILKRYFRLMLPLLPIGLLVYFMLRFQCFSHMEVAALTQSPWAIKFYTNTISLKSTLKSIFFNIWFVGDSRLSTAFWMLSDLFYGTFISVILSVITWRYKKNTWLIYFVLTLAFLTRNDISLAFIAGVLLADIFMMDNRFKRNIYLGVMSLSTGLFLGGYPSGVLPTNFYCFFNNMAAWNWHVIGAFLTLFGIWNCKGICHLLSSKVFLQLGKISYAVYLLHIPLLFSLSTSTFLWINKYLKYSFSVLISLLISTFVLVVTAFVYNRVVETGCVLIQKKILGLFLED